MPVTGEDALRTLAVADALTESARTGRPMEVQRD
jgi:predicted dehydrogenase